MNATKTVAVDNQIGSRSIRHINLLLCPGQGIVEFKGKSIPPVLAVIKEEYVKQGKWSHTTWTCEVDEDYHLVSFAQDWGTGKWFPTKNWPTSVFYLDEQLGGLLIKSTIHYDLVVRFIRATWPELAAEFDRADEEFSLGKGGLQELFAAQKELVEASEALGKEVQEQEILIETIRLQEETQRLRKEAEIERNKLQKGRDALKSGKNISLADLKLAMES